MGEILRKFMESLGLRTKSSVSLRVHKVTKHYSRNPP